MKSIVSYSQIRYFIISKCVCEEVKQSIEKLNNMFYIYIHALHKYHIIVYLYLTKFYCKFSKFWVKCIMKRIEMADANHLYHFIIVFFFYIMCSNQSTISVCICSLFIYFCFTQLQKKKYINFDILQCTSYLSGNK